MNIKINNKNKIDCCQSAPEDDRLTSLLEGIATSENRAIFEAFYYQYRGQLLAAAGDILHDRHLAENTVDEVMRHTAGNLEELLIRFRTEAGKEPCTDECEEENDLFKCLGDFTAMAVKSISSEILRENRRKLIMLYGGKANCDCSVDADDASEGCLASLIV
jgi:hypothetical protein